MKVKNKISALAWMLVTAIVCNGCTGNVDAQAGDGAVKPDSVLTPEYAEYFCIEYYPTYKQAVVLNPWDSGKVMARYTITVAADNVAAGSCCHVAFISSIGCGGTIKGVCSAPLIYNEAVRETLSNGDCKDLGDSFAVNFEQSVMLAPQLFFHTLFNQPDQNIKRLNDAGTETVGTVEWIEPDILGRAEWIKFIAAFYGKEAVADSIFRSVADNYNKIKNAASGYAERPSILPGLTFKGTWYMPAGKSFMNQLFNDAGGSYHFASNDATGSLPLSLEYVLSNFSDCDVWLGLDVDSYKELEMTDIRLTELKPFRERNAYNQNKRKLPGGANDFWENGVVHPDWVLSDLVEVLHGAGDSTIFLKRLRE